MFLKIFEKFIHGLSFGLGMGISFIIIPKERKIINSPQLETSTNNSSITQPDTPLSMSPLLRCG